MKKLIFLFLICNLFANEIQFAKGEFSVDADFLGLNSSNKENIYSISFVNEHKNIFSSKFFYSYKLSYFKSNTLKNYFNNTSINNKLRGVDLNFIVGRDFIKENQKDTYLGFGLLLGASFPYLKTSGSSSKNYLKKSKTKIKTYKIGIDLKGEKSFGFLNFYFNSAYAKQIAKIKNNVLNLNSYSNGDYYTFNGGIKLQAKTKRKFYFLTFSPSFFITFGYRWNYWKVNNVDIDSILLKTDIKLTISEIYLGLGYDF